ncbi:Pyridoxine 5'-phosphate synthase [Nymphon striatum]|nr:Pyridoxine 5'-phosphate synthase [Nymphon striatum]
MVGIACDVRPEDACIVPEKREELTTEGGLDIIGQFDRIQKCTKTLSNKISGHMQMQQGDDQSREFDRILEATEFAHAQGIHVNAGHGLDYSNTTAIAKIPQIRELNIGHSIVSRAVFVGISRATRQMLQIMREARDLSIGTDIVQTKRIKRLVNKFPTGFVERILHKNELEIYKDFKNPVSYLARRFAAKEAVAKALGTWHR